MLIIEQFTSHAPTLPSISLNSSRPLDVHFDVDLGELERQEGLGHAGNIRAAEVLKRVSDGETRVPEKAYPLTVGLVVHGLADGLALGVSALGNTGTELSLVVFLALIIHKGSSTITQLLYHLLIFDKAPTALALTTSLLSTALPRSDCKKHIAFFSVSTPFGALVSYGLFSFLEAGGEGDWTGTALLISVSCRSSLICVKMFSYLPTYRAGPFCM
jgi:zinc transporter 9